MTDQNTQFFAILTAIGKAKQANADALGIPWTFAQMGVGDANDTDPIPNEQQTHLINERRRAPLNQLSVDSANPNIIVAEQVIPENVGGWWIREVGLYDADGDLVAVANCAPSFKPLLTQGSGRTQVVRMNLIVSNTANVELKIDPSVVLATRTYVDSKIREELHKLDSKQSVRVATTANIALTGLQVIDGVTLLAGDRVLVKNQTAAKDNGIYIAGVAAWQRAQDADSSAEVTPALLVSVEQGSSQADTRWQLVTDGTITLGNTALTFQNVTQGYAPINSPAFSGVPTAPTAAPNVNNTQVATTAFVNAALNAVGLGEVVGSAYIADMNDVTLPSGVYYASGGTTLNLPPAAQVNGTVIHKIYGGGGLQIFQGYATEQLYWRRKTPEQWESWNSLASLDSPAFIGNPTAPTPPQFDKDKSLATTEFVQRALGNYAGVSSVNGGTVTLTASSFGKVISVNAATTVILPTGSALVPGSTMFFFIYSGVRPTFVCQGADKISTPAGAGFYSSFTIKGTGFAELMWDGGGWALCGTAVLEESSAFGANLSTNGYQKLPSGLIIQWGTQILPASVTTTFWFPLAYPNQCLSIVATFGTPAQGSVNADVVNASQYKLQNLYAGSQAARWVAIGN